MSRRPATERTYSSAEVCDLAGVTYRQLDYWTRIGLVEPSVAVANGSGSRRCWTADDLARVNRVRLAAELSSGSLQDCLDRLDEVVGEYRLLSVS